LGFLALARGLLLAAEVAAEVVAGTAAEADAVEALVRVVRWAGALSLLGAGFWVAVVSVAFSVAMECSSKKSARAGLLLRFNHARGGRQIHFTLSVPACSQKITSQTPVPTFFLKISSKTPKSTAQVLAQAPGTPREAQKNRSAALRDSASSTSQSAIS